MKSSLSSAGLPDVDRMLTTPAVLEWQARALPGHPALVTEERTFTFAQLYAEVRRTAAAIVALGVAPGDRVALCAPNTWHWVVAALATQYAGGVLVPVNTSYTPGEIGDVLVRTGAPLLFTTGGSDVLAELNRLAGPALRHIVRVPTGMDETTGGYGVGWDDFIAGQCASDADVDARAAAVRPDDVADILFTSGTTGRSKGVMCSHRQSLSASRSWAQTGAIDSADRYLCVNPFFHNFGFKAGILACLQTGATLVPQRTFDPESALRTVQEQRITVLPGPPTLYQVLLDHPDRAAFDLSSWRFAVTGAAMVPVVLIERMRAELGIDIVLTAYGLTEACGFGTMCRPGDDPLTVATTCGRPIAGFEVRIDAPDSAGTGEVLLRGPNVMLGYLDDPEATSKAVDAQGWLHTGDVGIVDEAGNLRITDRLTDMYICGGLNVYPAEVERVLTGLEGVVEAAVIGVPHESLGEVGRAFIVTRPGARLDAASVIAHTREQLANFKTPRSVVFVDQLPRNRGGKVLKTALREADHHPDRSGRLTAQGQGGEPQGPMECWIADAWQSLLDIDRPGRLDRFTDLGGNSLSAVELARILHKQFGIRISVDRFAANPTIAALANDLAADVPERRDAVSALRTDGSGPVYLVVPGWNGNALAYSALASALAGPCDVIALTLTDVVADAGPVRAAVRSAALSAVRHQAATGRQIAVAGFSVGALVATDLACWLPEQGVPVARLYLLDPNPLHSAPPRISGIRDGLRRMSPSAYYSLKRRFRTARRFDDEIETAYLRLDAAYRDGSIRLPSAPVSWVQSRDLNDTHSSATTIFGTPIEAVERELIDVDVHRDLLQKSNADWLADWIDRHPPIDTCPHRVVVEPSNQPSVHLRRNGFDPAPELAEMRDRAGAEVVPTPFGAKTYVLTRYDDVRTMLTDYKRFSVSPPWMNSGAPALSTDGQDDPRAGNLMLFDPPEHTRLRRMLAAQFTAERVARLEQHTIEIVEDRLSAMERAGNPVDLMETYAQPISSQMICELLGVPYDDRQEFQRRGAREFDMNLSIDDRTTIGRESQAYMAELVAGARHNPGKDILGMLVREHGGELTDAELTGIGRVLLQAGHETVANMIGLGTLALLRHPDQAELLREDPDAVGPAVEELLRWLSILQTGTPRYTVTDVEVAGVVIPARHPVFASLPTANRDPAYIDDPETLDIRRGATGHLAFGHGIHRCLGAPLARMEMRIALPALLRRFPNLTVAEPFDHVSFRSNHFIYGLKSLLVMIHAPAK